MATPAPVATRLRTASTERVRKAVSGRRPRSRQKTAADSWISSMASTIWRSAASLIADAAAHYPDGVSANLQRARRAAQVDDVAGVVTALRAAARRGYTLFEPSDTDPAFAGVRRTPEFRAVISEIAEGWIIRGREREDPTQQELQMIGHAHFARGEKAEAIAVLRRALAKGGARDEQIRADLAALGEPVPGPE